MERRLSAIFAADMVGYSRLMEADEMGTIERQKVHRKELIDPTFGKYQGRIVKEMGDGILVEFPSVVKAVECAVEIQRAMSLRESGVAEIQRISYRIGINLGDIVVDDDDIYGDGVNVAARLESFAEPGGICISGTVHDHIEGRMEISCHYMGEQQLKNISRPVQVYRVSVSDIESVSGRALPSNPALPDKPSVAVLAFDNMSGDPEQEYFSDGMSEDIITALSRLRWLFVIARNSTFSYKGQAVDIKTIGRELGVRYVLEGSVRKAGNRIRVTAQLIEVASGNHIWAQRYDRDLADIFDLQDELTEAISANVDTELAASERQLAHKKTQADLGTWELYQRGLSSYYKYSKDDFAEARRLFSQATERSPEFAAAYAGLADVAAAEASNGFAEDPVATRRQGLLDAERALALDERDPGAQAALGRICLFIGNGERAIAALEKAIDLNPNFAAAHNFLGQALIWAGRAPESISILNRAIRLSPRDPQLWIAHNNKCVAHSDMEKLDAAMEDAKAAIREKPDAFWPHMQLARVCYELGRYDEARAAYDRASVIRPNPTEAGLRSMVGTVHGGTLENFLSTLRKMGLPEK